MIAMTTEITSSSKFCSFCFSEENINANRLIKLACTCKWRNQIFLRCIYANFGLEFHEFDMYMAHIRIHLAFLQTHPLKNIVIFEIIKISFSPKNLSSCLVFFFWLLDSSFWIIILRANPLRKSFRMTGRRHRSRISANASASLLRWNIEPSSNFRISRYVLFDESGTLQLAFIQQINIIILE